MTATTDDLSRLARAVKQRRLTLGLPRLKAANEAGISKDTWKRVEEALPVREMSYAAIDPVLGWAVGSCDNIRAGGSSTVVEESEVDPGVTLVTVSDSVHGATVRRVVESATIAVTNLPASEIRKLTERIINDLRKSGIIA